MLHKKVHFDLLLMFISLTFLLYFGFVLIDDIILVNTIRIFGTIPCSTLGAQIIPPIISYFFLKIRGGYSRFFLVLDPARGSNPLGL